MKTNMQRAAVVLLAIAGLTALNGSKAFRLHADSQVCTHGKFSGSSTADYGGTVFPVTFTGTYSVKPNCTGSLTADAGANGIIHRDLVIVDSGKEVEFVSTDAGLVISGYMKKQHTE